MREGTVLDGRYRLIQRIGAGGCGQVQKAHDPKIDRHVAVKVRGRGRNTRPSPPFCPTAPASLVHAAARGVGDVSYPVRDAAGTPLTAFTGTQLASSSPPGRGPLPGRARGGQARVGERVTLNTSLGRRTFTFSGTTGTPGVWFTDAQALAHCSELHRTIGGPMQPPPGADAPVS
ncbi:hypothetical protein [Streptomyces californicus]|uniref:hypothetical protein n=1 Tax=Streptomyces californicus TaxID=67351 RepID=UPI0037F9E435